MQGIDPPSYALNRFNKIEINPIINDCIKCGRTHGVCLEEMETGKLTPLDYCMDCLFKVENGTSTTSGRA